MSLNLTKLNPPTHSIRPTTTHTRILHSHITPHPVTAPRLSSTRSPPLHTHTHTLPSCKWPYNTSSYPSVSRCRHLPLIPTRVCRGRQRYARSTRPLATTLNHGGIFAYWSGIILPLFCTYALLTQVTYSNTLVMEKMMESSIIFWFLC